MPVSRTDPEPSSVTVLARTAAAAELAAAITEASRVDVRSSAEAQLRQYLQQDNPPQYGHANALLRHLSKQPNNARRP